VKASIMNSLAAFSLGVSASSISFWSLSMSATSVLVSVCNFLYLFPRFSYALKAYLISFISMMSDLMRMRPLSEAS